VIRSVVDVCCIITTVFVMFLGDSSQFLSETNHSGRKAHQISSVKIYLSLILNEMFIKTVITKQFFLLHSEFYFRLTNS